MKKSIAVITIGIFLLMGSMLVFAGSDVQLSKGLKMCFNRETVVFITLYREIRDVTETPKTTLTFELLQNYPNPLSL